MLVIVQAAFLNPEARNLVAGPLALSAGRRSGCRGIAPTSTGRAARVQAQGLGPSTEERNIDRVLGSTVE